MLAAQGMSVILSKHDVPEVTDALGGCTVHRRRRACPNVRARYTTQLCRASEHALGFGETGVVSASVLSASFLSGCHLCYSEWTHVPLDLGEDTAEVVHELVNCLSDPPWVHGEAVCAHSVDERFVNRHAMHASVGVDGHLRIQGITTGEGLPTRVSVEQAADEGFGRAQRETRRFCASKASPRNALSPPVLDPTRPELCVGACTAAESAEAATHALGPQTPSHSGTADTN